MTGPMFYVLQTTDFVLAFFSGFSILEAAVILMVKEVWASLYDI